MDPKKPIPQREGLPLGNSVETGLPKAQEQRKMAPEDSSEDFVLEDRIGKLLPRPSLANILKTERNTRVEYRGGKSYLEKMDWRD